MKDYIRKRFALLVIWIYMFVMLFQSVPFINFVNKVQAEDVITKDNLVLVLVDSNVYKSNIIKTDILWYSKYIQTVNKNTKALVFPIDVKKITSYDILKVIQNLYFNWEKTKRSFLKTIVLIWNIPLPVVDKNWFIYSTIYPYVDIVKPTFKYDWESKYFKFSWKTSNVELSHWIIKFNNISDYHKYFQKLKKYFNNPSDFVDKQFYMDNFISQANSFNKSVLKLYLNKLIFWENLITRKITPLLLKFFDNQNKKDLTKNLELKSSWDNKTQTFKSVDGKVAKLLWFNWSNISEFSSITDKYNSRTADFMKKFKDITEQVIAQENPMNQTPTLMLEKSLKNFFRNYISLFWNTYWSNLTKNLDATWRYTWNNTISSLNMIDIKDNLSITYLNTINKFLEQKIDEKIDNEQYYMYYPLMISYYKDYNINWFFDWRSTVDAICNKKKYETFFFGKAWKNISSLQDIHIFRWTYWNYTWLNILTKLKGRWKKSSLSNMNWLFNTQIQANRWFNTLGNAKKDWDNFKNWCSKINWACNNLWRNSNSENILSWSKRIYWWYSPLNIDTDSMKKNIMKMKFADYKQAWNPSYSPAKDWTLFDLWGSKQVESKQSTWYTDTIDGIKHYVSVWQTQYYTTNFLDCSLHYNDWTSKIAWTYYDYLKDFNSLCKVWWCSSNSCFISENGLNFVISSYGSYNKTMYTYKTSSYIDKNWDTKYHHWWDPNNNCNTIIDLKVIYKFIDTRIKHVSPTSTEFSWFNLVTKSRPVDSKNYISFLWVWWKTIKLDYPDLFNVYVYKKVWDNLILKTPEQISNTIKDYLKSIVIKYNNKLQTELNNKNIFYNTYKKAFDKISNFKYKPHTYNLLSENYLINKLWEEKISEIAEQLYYLNLWWKKKPVLSSLSWEINYLYKSFNINEKIWYLVKNYIDTESKYNINWNDISHKNVNFPLKPNKWWYEAWIIISKNTDSDIWQKDKWWFLNSKFWNNRNIINNNPLPINVSNANPNECWRPLWEAVIIFQWPSAFMCRLKETLKKPFKIGSTSECVVWQTLEDAKDALDKLEKDDGSEYKNDPNKYEQWKKWKLYIDNNITVNSNKQSYFYTDISWDLQIVNYWGVNELTNQIKNINIKSPNLTGNCFYFKKWDNYINSCEWLSVSLDNWKIPFYFYNPKTSEWKYYSYKAWTKYINVQFCNYDNICYAKQLVFDKNAWKLKYIELKPFSQTMVYGWENPFVLQWYDSLPEQWRYQNEVYYTPYNYQLFTDPNIWLIKSNLQTKWVSSIDYNFPSSSNLLVVKSNSEPISWINKFNIVLKMDPVWKEMYKDDNSIIKEYKKQIYITKKDKLLSSEVVLSSWDYQLSDNPYSLIKYVDTIPTYNSWKLLKIHLNPIVADKTLKTPFTVETTDNFIAGKFIKATKKLWTKKVKFQKFVKQNKFLITKDWGIDIYLLPTYKTWKYKITIKIPWISPYVINGQLKDFPIKNVFIQLNKTQADKNEVIEGKIYGIDKFGNFQDNLDWIQITHSDGISVILNWNTIKVKWTKSWFIKVNLKWKENSIYFTVNNTFIPFIDKVSVMYLTLFWYNWWKYASKIMWNSDKNLAITATDKNPKSLHHYDYSLWENLIIKWFPTSIELKNNAINFNVWEFNLFYNWNIFWNIKKENSLNTVFLNWIYYIPEKIDDIIKSNILADGQLYINSNSVINFNNLTQDSDIVIQYSTSLSDKYWFAIYNVVLKNKKIWVLAFKWKNLNLSKLSISKPYYTKIIYWDWTTNWLKAFGISLQNQEYNWISKNTNLDYEDKWLWFRSNFKNITNFAWGEDVWNSTKAFQNEFLINYWDPFVKRISKEDIIPQVWLSKTYWYRIYSNIAWWIKKVIPLDFNNDWLKDLVVAYKWNKVRFLKHYKWKYHFEDLWNLMVLWKWIKDIFAWDYNWDWYKDIFVSFIDGSVKVYKNNHWEFDVNWTPICLNLPWTDWFHLQYAQIFFRDMNNNWKTDIVVNDNASNIKVFFDWTYLSKSFYKCDNNYKSRSVSKLVKSYSYKVQPDKKFADDWYIYWEWLKDTNDSKLLEEKYRKAFQTKDFSDIPTDSNITPSNYTQKVSNWWKNKFAYQDIPRVLWPTYEHYSWSTIWFKKITFLSWSDPIQVYKTMKDLNWGALLPWDKIKITVHIENNTNKRITYLEALKWPFAVIWQNNEPILELNWISSWAISYPKRYPMFLFRINNVSNSFTVSYVAYYQWDSSVKIKVWDYDKNSYGDIKVFLNNGCIKWYDYFQWQSWSPMNFNYSYKDLAQKLRDKINNLDNAKKISSIIDKTKNWNYEDVLKDVWLDKSIWWSKWNSILSSLENWWDIDVSVDIWPDISAIKAKTAKILQWLCNGFSFWKSSCGWSPIPCNYAFLAPWTINACGCPLWTDPWTSVFWFPWTKWQSCHGNPCCIPIPTPNKTSMSVSSDPPNQFKPSPCPWVYPSTIRLYVAPTLSEWLWVAVCFGLYKVGMHLPPAPAGTIAWNCVVVAWELSSSCSVSSKNYWADDELDDWMTDLDNWICSQLPVQTWQFPSSSLFVSNWWGFIDSNINPSFNASVWWNSLVSFQRWASIVNMSKTWQTKMQWWSPFHLNVQTWTFWWLIKCIIKKWMNKQIEFLIAQLTHMTLYIVYPDFSWLMKWFSEKDWNKFWSLGDLNKMFDWFKIWESSNIVNKTNSKILKNISKYLPSWKWFKKLNRWLSNPFKLIQKYFEDVPLINVQLKTIVIKIPWIGKEELERQILYLKDWLKRNKKNVKKWTDFYNSAVWKCADADTECKNKYSSMLKVQKFIQSVQKNIEILNEYKTFPFKLYKYLHLVDFYLSQLMCIINKYLDMILGWYTRQSKIFEKWVDAIVAIINIIKTWQLIIDFSVNWKTTCWKCRQDTWDLYDCVLSLLCIDLPVLPIPPFKIPDIYLDFSHFNMWIDIILPKIKIAPVPIWVFTLPDLPYPNISLELPALPLLPEPPILPELPSLPPMPTLELPNLPPPPKIPKLLPSIKAVLNILKIIWYYYCIIKNWIWLVAEWNVKTRIEQLTARHNRIFPFDFLNLDLPILPFAWFDIRVDTYVKYRLELSLIYDVVKWIADSINEKTKPMIWSMLEFNYKTNAKTDNLNEDLQNYNWDINIQPKWAFIMKKQKDDLYAYVLNNSPVSVKLAKALLYNQLSYLSSQRWEDYLKSLPSSIFDRSDKLKKFVIAPNNVKANKHWLQAVRKQIQNIFNKENIRLQNIENKVKQMQAWQKVDISDTSIFEKTKNNNLVSSKNIIDKKIVLSTSLFTASKHVYNLLWNTERPEKSYLKMYKKVLLKLDKKLPVYAKWKVNQRFMYETLKNKVDDSLKVIDNTLDEKLFYASPTTVSSSAPTQFPISADPSQNIRGLYVKGNDWTYYNVMKNKDKAQIIRKKRNYTLEDMNQDNIKDMIWYDNYNIYIKYSWDQPKDDGIIYTQEYIYNWIVSDFNSIVDNNWYVSLWNSKFKLVDKNISVVDLTSAWQAYNSVKLKYSQPFSKLNSYTLLYSSRIDVLDWLEKKYNNAKNFNYAWNNYKTYWVVFYDKKLWDINEIKASKIIVKWHQLNNIVYIPVDMKKNMIAILDKKYLFLHDKWKYFRVYSSNLNLEQNKLIILSSYSNQDLWWEQIIADNTSPYIITTLVRDKWNELNHIIWTWNHLVWYVNTAYHIKWHWTDNLWLDKKFITDDKFNILKTWDSIAVYSNQPVKKTYYFIGQDLNWNISKIKITVDIKVPDVDINKINTEVWIVWSNVWSDMDKTAIKYAVVNWNNIKILKNLNNNSLFTWWVWQVQFTWSIFNMNKKVILYDKVWNSIWYLNLDTWEIKLKDLSYYILWIIKSNMLVYNVYNDAWEIMFQTHIPSKSLVSEPVLHNSNKYTIKQLTNSNVWIFDWWYCMYDNINKMCAVYVSVDWIIYIDNLYSDKFIVSYNYNLWNITSTFYDLTVPDKNKLTEDKKLFSIIFRADKMYK